MKKILLLGLMLMVASLHSMDQGQTSSSSNVLGIRYYLAQDMQKAAECFQQAIDEEDIDGYNNLALIYDEQGDQDKARTLYQQAAEKGHNAARENLRLLEGKYHSHEKIMLFFITYRGAS